MRVLLAIWVAKLAQIAIRALGRAGTHLPGVIAARLHPRLIAGIAHPPEVIVVTGTNGKTTVCKLLTEALTAEGRRVVGNRGSNIVAGFVSALVDGVDWRGRSIADIAVLELDERTARLILPDLAPDIVLCTNLTRDSIKRNAHPAYIAWLISSALSADTRLILNADDLITAGLGGETNPRVFFGVDRLPGDTTTPGGAAVDLAICPRCDHLLDWDFWRFNHIGQASCPACGFHSPAPDYVARGVRDGRLLLGYPGQDMTVRLVNDNVVNLTNQVAVAAALDVLGVPRDRAAAAFEWLEPPATRFSAERFARPGGEVVLVRQLTKGLVGVACSRAFQYVMSLPGRKSMVLDIDEATDVGRDVENTTWIYDADYEYLADDSLEQIVIGGERRYDQALRLALAGVDPARFVITESETDAAELVRVDDVDLVFNLHSVHNSISTGSAVQARLEARLAENGQGS